MAIKADLKNLMILQDVFWSKSRPMIGRLT